MVGGAVVAAVAILVAVVIALAAGGPTSSHRPIYATVPAATRPCPGELSCPSPAASLVGSVRVHGLAGLYCGVMQKRWSINSMVLTFATCSVVLLVWVLWGFKMGLGTPWHGLSHSGFFGK